MAPRAIYEVKVYSRTIDGTYKRSEKGKNIELWYVFL